MVMLRQYKKQGTRADFTSDYNNNNNNIPFEGIKTAGENQSALN